MTNFIDVTELSGDEVSREQIERITHRYVWAANYCKGKDVAEVACGTGQGLGILSDVSASLKASDYSQDIIDIAKAHYEDRLQVEQIDAQNMPYADNSLDVIILFESIYYIPDATKFILECKRVLRNGGKILIATANKDLYDFNPSPHSFKYFGVEELNQLLSENGFASKFFGYLDVGKTSVKQKILRPVKKVVVALNLMPKTMTGKKILKRLVFGKMAKMPAEVNESMVDYYSPAPLSNNAANKTFKVIYCEASLVN